MEYAKQAVKCFKTAISRRISSRKEGLNASQRDWIKWRISKEECWQYFRGGWRLYRLEELLALLGDTAESAAPQFNCGYTCRIARDLSALEVFLDGYCIARAALRSAALYSEAV